MSIINTKTSDLTKSKEIAAGGEGRIFEHPSDKTKVIKIYHQARNPSFIKHLEKLSTELGSLMFVRPIDIYINSKGEVIGFSMNYVNFNDYWLFNNLFNKGFCNSNSIDKQFKIKVLNKMADCINMLKTSNIVVGDLNQYNLFVNKNADILFVDVDSYQTANNKHSGVLLDDIRDWTTPDINDKTDMWAYDILAFWATTYCHPYKWVCPGNTESLEQRVKTNKSILKAKNIPGIKIPPLYEAPTGFTHDQFSEIFNGRRFLVSFSGTGSITSPIIIKQNLVSNHLNIRKLYESVIAINCASDYIAIKILNENDWILVETKIPKITRQVVSVDCDELYPSDKKYAYVKKDVLFCQDLSSNVHFKKPIFQFNNGYLCVIDYDKDIQWNFNINNQLAGIDNTNTPVFAKSIIKRDGLLQNFGAKKYINVPNGNRYTLFEVPLSTKNSFHVNGYLGIEYIDNKSVKYVIKQANTNMHLEFDYLPYFTVLKNGVILIPEDSFIHVHDSNLNLISKFDCPMCTRSSKLFQTNAGILLYENNELYLLNTK